MNVRLDSPNADVDGYLDDELNWNDDFNEDELNENIDPIDEEVAARIDGELSPEESDAFDKRLALDPELKKRYDAQRNAWDALGALDVPDDCSPDLVESAFDKLYAQTQTELATVVARRQKRRVLLGALDAFLVAAVAIGGFVVVSHFFPSVQTRRERDYRVVERLPQLEMIGDLEYLKALSESKLFEPSAIPSKPRSYDELKQDRVFYRRQTRFEKMERLEQKRWRALVAQIDEQPNAARLWGALDAYSNWLERSTSAADRNRLAATPNAARLLEIKKIRDDAEQSRTARPNAFPSSFRPNGRFQGPGGVNPARTFRLALPEELRDEDLTPLFHKYEEFCRANGRSSRDIARREDVLEFLTSAETQTLVAALSEEARQYLEAQSADEQSSIIGLLVALSFWENSERGAFIPRSEPFNAAFPRPQTFDFDQRRIMLTSEIANVLREASQEERDYIASLPVLEARGRLLGLLWGRRPFGGAAGQPENFSHLSNASDSNQSPKSSPSSENFPSRN